MNRLGQLRLLVDILFRETFKKLVLSSQRCEAHRIRAWSSTSWELLTSSNACISNSLGKMESIPSFRLTKHFAAEIVTNHKEIQIMSSHFSYTLLWLLLIVLAFAVALWSTNAPLAKAHSTSAGICKSRVQIFGYECEEHTVLDISSHDLFHSNYMCDHSSKIW